MTKYPLYVSVDPGIGKSASKKGETKGTGIVVWQNGKILKYGFFPTNKGEYRNKDHWDRCLQLESNISDFLEEFGLGPMAPNVDEVLVEIPHKFTPKGFLTGIFINCFAVAAIALFFRRRGARIVEITKRPESHKVAGKIKKGKDAGRLIAESLGVKGAVEHVNDAIHLGQLQGYHLTEAQKKRKSQMMEKVCKTKVK